MRRFLVAIFIGILPASACTGGENRLTVFAAASLTEVLRDLAPGARYSFAGSDLLAAQIREGADADVYASASPIYTRRLFEHGLIEEPAVFASNRVVLIVPRANPADIHSLTDVARPGVKLLVGAPGVPIGDYTRRLLENLDALDVLRNVVSEEQDVKGIVGKVAQGEADAGFVYATDVRSVGDRVATIELPTSRRPRVSYTVAIATGTDMRAEARAFVVRLLGAPGRESLRAAGFAPP